MIEFPAEFTPQILDFADVEVEVKTVRLLLVPWSKLFSFGLRIYSYHFQKLYRVAIPEHIRKLFDIHEGRLHSFKVC